MGSKNSKNKKKKKNANTNIKVNTNANSNINSNANTNINSQKSKIDEENEININPEEVKSLFLSQNKELLNFAPPIFKKIKKFNRDNENNEYNEYFYIYKLKDINDALYISFLIVGEGIVIYKYCYEKEMLEKINIITINVGFSEKIIIRYFFNECDKKEYLFFEKGPHNLFIYLIKDEKNYELMYMKLDIAKVILNIMNQKKFILKYLRKTN